MELSLARVDYLQVGPAAGRAALPSPRGRGPHRWRAAWAGGKAEGGSRCSRACLCLPAGGGDGSEDHEAASRVGAEGDAEGSGVGSGERVLPGPAPGVASLGASPDGWSLRPRGELGNQMLENCWKNRGGGDLNSLLENFQNQ